MMERTAHIEGQIEALAAAVAIVMATISEASDEGRAMMLDGLRWRIQSFRAGGRHPGAVALLRQMEDYLASDPTSAPS